MVIASVPLILYYRFIPANLVPMDDCIKYCNSDYLVRNIFDGNDKKVILDENNYSLPEDIFDGKTHANIDSCEISNIKKGYLTYTLDYKVNNASDKKCIISFPFFRYKNWKKDDNNQNVENQPHLNYKEYKKKVENANEKTDKNIFDAGFGVECQWDICKSVSDRKSACGSGRK